jgi:hypothetical protein
VYTVAFVASIFFATSLAALSESLFPTLLTMATFSSFKYASLNYVYIKMIFLGSFVKTNKYESIDVKL